MGAARLDHARAGVFNAALGRAGRRGEGGTAALMANLPDPQPLLDLNEGFRRSKTMFVAASMGVFDRLHEAPATAAAMAHNLNAHPGSIESLLDACAALGLLRKENDAYANEEIAEVYLCSGSPYSLHAYVR